MPKWIPLLTLCLLSAAAVPALAQEGPPPAGEGRDRDEDDRGRRDRRPEPMTEAQWQEADAFLREHSSQRMKVFDAYRAANPDQTRQIERLRRGIYGKYQILRRLEQENPELYAFTLAQMDLENDIRTRIEAANEAGRNPAEDVRIRELTTEYVNNVLKARTERLKRFREMMETQQRRLEEDRSRIDALVTDQVTRWKSTPALDDGPRGPRGPHPDGPPPPPREGD